MKRELAANWVDLQRQLDWLADGVVINSLSVEEYIAKVRKLLENYEFMAVHRGN